MAGGEMLLIVEDDETVRDYLAQVLREAGYTVVPVANGRDALEYLRQHLTPALILLDMMLPETDGGAFLRRQAPPPGRSAAPVVIFTGLACASPEWARDLGARGILRKPVEVEAVLHEVQRCLAERKP